MKTKVVTFIIQLPILLTFIIMCNQAFAWTHSATFENGLTGSDGFSGIGSTVQRVQEIAHTGNYSARIYFPRGDRCWDSSLTCGAIFNAFHSPVSVGDELWTRMYVYFPSGWDWGDIQGNGNWRKIMRYTIGSRGNISTVGLWNGDTSAEILGNTEAGNYYPYEDQFTGSNYPVGQWFALEQYVRFGTTDDTTSHRIWLNGRLVFDSGSITRDNPALGSTSDTCTRVLFFTYWNGAVRTNQSAYIDDIVITTDRPSGRDAHGNPMIGLISSSNPSTPGPTTVSNPTNLKIISP
jgi:hypothetical protein